MTPRHASLIQPPATNTRHSHRKMKIMVNTTNYALEKYESGNSANLLDQYNASMDKIDTAIKSVSDKADLALNRTGTEIFTVADLSNLKKTVEGYPIPPTE